MPGILYNMDRFEKRLIEAHFLAKGVGPKWLDSLGCTGPVTFPAKMTQDYPELGLTLVGMPDAVFKKKDGSLCLVDYKTAGYKGAEDPFMPCYETQLWGYTRLLEHYGIGKVSSTALVYFANTLKDYDEKPLDLLTNDGIRVPFAVKIHELEVNRKGLYSLLKAFRMYADMPAPPAGSDKCKTCKRLKLLFEIEQRLRGRNRSIKDLENRDSVALNMLTQKWETDQRQSRIRESREWEDELSDGLLDFADCVPGALDT